MVAYAPKAATKPSIAAQPLNFSASGVIRFIESYVKECNGSVLLIAGGQPNIIVKMIACIRKIYISKKKSALKKTF